MSRTLLTFGLPLLGLLGAAMPSGRAEACSPPYPGLTDRRMHPPDGTANVPLNVQLVVRYQGQHPGNPLAPNVNPLGSDLQLRKTGGAVVPTTIKLVPTRRSEYAVATALVVQPMQPLEPGTVYEVLDGRRLPCLSNAPADQCAPGTPIVFGRFTTGTTEDRAPPTFGGLKPITVLGFDQCNSSACCGPYVVRQVNLSWESGVDVGSSAGKNLLYNLYREGTATPVVALWEDLPPGSLSAAIRCGPGTVGAQGIYLEPGTYSVRAVDWAGYESDSVTTNTIGADICANIPDAAVSDPRDGGADQGSTPPDVLPGQDDAVVGHDAAISDSLPDVPRDVRTPQDVHAPHEVQPRPSPPSRSKGGCSFARGGGAGSTAWWLLSALFLAVWFVRRRNLS